MEKNYLKDRDMKKIYLIFTLLGAFMIPNFTALSGESLEERTDKAFRRCMLSAHPLPAYEKVLLPLVPLADEIKNPSYFVNVMIIEDNEPYQLKMQNESSIAVSPVNPDFLIASSVDYRNNSSTWIYMSHDGGKTWVNRHFGHPFDDWRSTNDPSVAFDPDGNGFLVYGGFPDAAVVQGSRENGVFIAKTTDMGASWRAHIPVILHKGEMTLDSAFDDKYYISVDNSKNSPYHKHLYIPWKRVTPRDSATQIVVSKSTDAGETWSKPVSVSKRVSGSSEDTTFGQSFPLITTGPEGTVYLVWNHGIDHGVGFARSEDGGTTWTEPGIAHHYNIFGITKDISGGGEEPIYRHTVKNTVRAEAYPVIVCDTTEGLHRGRLYLCWSADRIPNVYFSYSDDKGETWSEPVRVHSEEKNDQFWQWLSFDPKTGDIAIMYLDSRNDPENIMVECFVAYSSDGGETWIDRRVSDISSDLRLNPFTANAFAGDYSGCAFYDGKIYPSWVDMRNAVEDIFDSEVHTALINVRAPMPPENFAAHTQPEKFDEIKLDWEAPSERVFGQPLLPDDFVYILFRDGEFLTEISSEKTEYFDKGLTEFEEYHYEIAAVSGSDTSIFKQSSAYAGGAKKPAPPQIVHYETNEDNDAVLFVRIPSMREDKITPLVNLNRVVVFKDGGQNFEESLAPQDTGVIIKLTLPNTERGYYNFKVRVSDSFEPPNTSDFSKEIMIYCGPVNNDFAENFDSGSLPKYGINEAWELTSSFYFSEPNCITDSKEGKYGREKNNFFTLFPVRKGSWNAVRFRHAALIHVSDSAIVEISKDMGRTWQVVNSFNKMSFEPWKDKNLDAADWKEENVFLDELVENNDTVTVRFRLKSNPVFEDDGWYIDDISFNMITGVDELTEEEKHLEIYPNPSSDKIVVNLKNINENFAYDIELYSAYGKYIPLKGRLIDRQKEYLIIDVNGLANGAYAVVAKENGRTVSTKFFTVIK